MIRATPVPGSGWRLDGSALVPVAEPLVAPAMTDGGWVLVDVSAASATPATTIAPHGMADVRADGVVVASTEPIEPYLLGVVTDMAAAARAAVEIAAAHARERVQFGQPIAGFQAVQHLAADALMAIEAVELAAAEGAVGDAVALARSTIVEAVRKAHQITGGAGLYADHPIPQRYREVTVGRAILDELAAPVRASDRR